MNNQPPIRALERLRLRGHQFFVDHGIFRELFYANFHAISPRAFRSAQPSPDQLRRWHRRHGFRTVVNMRCPAPHEPHYRLEAEVCAELGMRMELWPGFGSRDLPSRENLLRVVEGLEQIAYPALFHCKSGADRAGFVSVLYLHVHEGVPMDRAARQLRLFPYGHIRHANTGVLDHFFASFQREAERHPGLRFVDWVREGYDREALLASFRPWYRLDWLTDRVLRRE